MAMIRDQVGPRLRELGLKGGGRNWEYPSDSHWVLLGFQGSQYNSSKTGRYTINLTVCSRHTWSEACAQRSYLPSKPKANVGYGTFCWRRRIGQLMPEPQDKWWEISADGSSHEVASEMLDAIEHLGLPSCLEQLRA